MLQWGVGRYLLRDESEDPDQPKEACSCWTVLEQARQTSHLSRWPETCTLLVYHCLVGSLDFNFLGK